MNIDLVEKALPYIREGKSWRKTAELLGVPRSTLSDSLREYVKTFPDLLKAPTKATEGPRVLILDLETGPAIGAVWGRFKQFLGQDNIISEGGMILCAGYKWLGSDEPVQMLSIKNQSLFDCNDEQVVAELWDLFEQADAVLAHNSRGFDVPMLRARVLYHGLPDLPHVKVLDTLMTAKKAFRLPNNKLDSIAAFLGLPRKHDAGGVETWLQYMMGNPEAVAHMHEYCERDVELLEQVYLRLRGYGNPGTDFNAAHYYNDNQMRCNKCGSPNVEETGRPVFTAISEFREVRCACCGGVSRTRVMKNTLEKRRSIVVDAKS